MSSLEHKAQKSFEVRDPRDMLDRLRREFTNLGFRAFVVLGLLLMVGCAPDGSSKEKKQSTDAMQKR